MLWSGITTGVLIGIGLGMMGTVVLKNDFGLQISRSLSFEVDPLGLVSLIVTVILALHITSKLNKKNEESRVTKDLFIKRLENLEYLILNKVRSAYKPKPFDFVSQVSKTIRTSVQEERNLLVRYKLIEDNNISVCKLSEKATELWGLLTFVPPIGSEDDKSPKVEDGKLVYPPEVIEQISIVLSDIKSLIADLQITVNCADSKN